MTTLEHFKDVAAKYLQDKTISNAMALGKEMLEYRRLAVAKAGGNLPEADLTEQKFLSWFDISAATARRLKLLAIWEKEVLKKKPESLTQAYKIAEELNKAALQKENSEVNRGGRPRKTDADRASELLLLAAEHWKATNRPQSEFLDRAKQAIQS
ncbi:hypothetical protein [Ruegeria sp. HKCCA5426]|uniref:hypothetical protein n=1 Tax=Ruegeria sp. HKCCA5426 TaxID=2682985 RepID=UPI0014886CFA|nr:hypothetical protein [Ruegeria sp. HKCCA5426]